MRFDVSLLPTCHGVIVVSLDLSFLASRPVGGWCSSATVLDHCVGLLLRTAKISNTYEEVAGFDPQILNNRESYSVKSSK